MAATETLQERREFTQKRLQELREELDSVSASFDWYFQLTVWSKPLITKGVGSGFGFGFGRAQIRT